MKEFIDKLIERLEEAKVSANRRNAFDSEISYACAIDIVNKLVEEYINCSTDTSTKLTDCSTKSEMPTNWITDRVPTKEECGNYGKEFLTTIPQGDEYKTVAMRYEYTTVRGKEVSRWTKYGRIAPWKPIAWCEMPAPYTEGE